MRKLFLIITTIIFTFTLNSVFAAEIEVKMLNKDADGNKMIFEPMLIMAEKGRYGHFFTYGKRTHGSKY